MRNLFLSPYVLYLANTKTAHLSGRMDYPKVQIYKKRENVAVMEVSNQFFELEKIKGHGLLLGKALPIRESSEEFIDITTFQKFPYEKDFDFDHANLKSLRSAYRKYQIMELGNVSAYHGKVTFNKKRTNQHPKDYLRKEILNMDKFLSSMDIPCIQLDDSTFMWLYDYLDGVSFSKNPLFKMDHAEFHPEEEIPLEELRNICISQSKEKKKCLHFPQSNI